MNMLKCWIIYYNKQLASRLFIFYQLIRITENNKKHKFEEHSTI
jgi:hypothetical protein